MKEEGMRVLEEKKEGGGSKRTRGEEKRHKEKKYKEGGGIAHCACYIGEMTRKKKKKKAAPGLRFGSIFLCSIVFRFFFVSFATPPMIGHVPLLYGNS